MKRFRVMLISLLVAMLIPVSALSAVSAIVQTGSGVAFSDGTPVVGIWESVYGDFLTLKTDGEAIFCVSDTLYVCRWSWDKAAVYLDYNGWKLTLTPSGSRLHAKVYGQAMSFTRVGDMTSNAGTWYSEGGTDGCTLQLGTEGEYRLQRNGGAARSGQWLDAGACVILMKADGSYEICVRDGERLLVRAGLSICSMMREAQPSQQAQPTAAPAAAAQDADVFTFRRSNTSSGRGVTGTWVEAAQGERVTLTVSSDTTAELRIGSTVFSYQWKLSDGVLTLTNRQMTVTGTYNSKTKTIELDADLPAFRNAGASASSGGNRTSTGNGSSTGSSGRGVTGTWTETSLGSSVTLTLQSNTTAVLRIYNTVYNCKWKLSGGVLTLTNNGITITGAYNSQTGVIQLTVDAYQLTFRKSGAAAAATGTSARSVVGTWTQHVTGGTVTLIVRADGSATLKIATTQYACTWKLSGSTFTLTNNGSPVRGTYNSQTDTISITIGTARLNLTRTGN